MDANEFRHALDRNLYTRLVPGSVFPSAIKPSDVESALTSDGTTTSWTPLSEFGGGGVSDHGALSGLLGDDHTQYHNNARGDARYYLKSEVDSALSGKSDTGHTHTLADVTDAGTAAASDSGDFAAVSHTHTESDITDLQDYALDADLTAHVSDSTDAHDASSISVADAGGYFVGGDVESALQELGAGGGGGGVTDHGALTGLGDDDHTQYHTDARGDARYYTQAQVDSALLGKSDTGHGHTLSDISDAGTAAASDVGDFATAGHAHSEYVSTLGDDVAGDLHLTASGTGTNDLILDGDGSGTDAGARLVSQASRLTMLGGPWDALVITEGELEWYDPATGVLDTRLERTSSGKLRVHDDLWVRHLTADTINLVPFGDLLQTGDTGPGGGLDADTVDTWQATDLLDRANHTGTQTLASISDAGTAAASDVGDFAAVSHTHTEADITDLGNYSEVGHTHTEADISDLQDYALDADLTSHLNDTSDAHDASAISVADAGGHFTGTDVEAVLQELGAGGGGSPTATSLSAARMVPTLGTNVNTSSSTLIPCGTPTSITGSDFSDGGSSSIQCDFDGLVLLTWNVEVTSTVARPNVSVEPCKNGVGLGAVAQHGYIRSSGGHTEASLNGSILVSVSSGDKLDIRSLQKAASGTVSVGADSLVQVVRLSSTANAYTSPPIYKAYRSAAAISGVTPNALTWDAEEIDQGFSISPGSTLAVPADGIYEITAQLVWENGSGAAWNIVSIEHEGAEVARQTVRGSSGNGAQCTAIKSCTAGDAFSVKRWSDASRDLTVGDSYCWVQIKKISE